MKLVVLGSGTSVPHPRRSASAHWLEATGGTLLLDAGASVGQRMAAEGLDWARLDAVWISHFHLDHVGGLAPFLFGTRHAAPMRERRKPLRIFGAHGLARLLRAFDEANHYRLMEQYFPVEVREVAPGERFDLLPGLRAETLSTPHTPESLALRLTDRDGATLVYSSDTGYTETLSEFARGVGLFLLECSFPREKPIDTHLVLVEAMRLAQQSAPRRLLLAHLYPDWDGLDLAAEASKLWDGETIEARDGLRLEINADGV